MRTLFVADQDLVESLRPALEEEGILVDAATKATDADDKMRREHYDAVLLDRDRLGSSGYSRLKRWRRGGLKAHVLVLLSANLDARDRIEALDNGADGYLVPPFCLEEVRARLRALGRHTQLTVAPVLRSHDLEINIASRSARRNGRAIDLTPREFDLLQLLAQNQGRIVSRSTLYEHLYDGLPEERSNVVDVYIRHLRRKIDN